MPTAIRSQNEPQNQERRQGRRAAGPGWHTGPNLRSTVISVTLNVEPSCESVTGGSFKNNSCSIRLRQISSVEVLPHSHVGSDAYLQKSGFSTSFHSHTTLSPHTTPTILSPTLSTHSHSHRYPSPLRYAQTSQWT